MSNAYKILLGILAVFKGTPGNLIAPPNGMSNEEKILYQIYRHLLLGYQDSGGGSGGEFGSDIDVILSGGKTLGKYVNGDTIPSEDLTAEEVLNLIAQEYLSPAFSSFNIGQTSPIEVGTIVTGVKTFTWSTSNGANVQPNTIEVRDDTGAQVLGTGLPNDGSEDLDVLGPIQKTSEATHTWQIELTNTLGGMTTRNDSVVWAYYQFYGPSASIPANSTEVRALPDSRFNNAGNTFNLNTGSTEINFIVAVPPGKSISQVIDLDALNTDITSQYVSQGTVNVVDAGGANVSYTVYAMTQAVPYSSNHRHEITLS